jgi:hypothetical protein
MPQFIAQVNNEALAAAATETLIQVVAASGRPAVVKEWSVSFDGVDATKTPIRVQLLRQSTAGTASALTLVKADETDSTAAAATAQKTFTVEPTASDILWSGSVSPAGGSIFIQYPLGDELVVGGGNRVGLRCTTATGVTANADAHIKIAE